MSQEQNIGRRQDYITVGPDGKPGFDLAKIYPDPAVQDQFRHEMDQLGNMHAIAAKYPKWAQITDRPAVVVVNRQGGHPACT